MADVQRDLTRNVLAVLFIGGLLATSLWLLLPFLAGFVWAVMIVVSTWPLLRGLQSLLWGQRWLAVTLMTVVLLVLLIVPLSAAIATLVSHADTLGSWAKQLADYHFPPAPAWLEKLPIVGDTVTRAWQQLESGGAKTMLAEIAPYAGVLAKWFVAQVGSFGALFVQFILTVVFAAILYANGEAASRWMLRFGKRLAGRNGEAAVKLSAQAIRGVALGVVVTALVQALLGGIGLAIAGVPFAALLTALMFILSVAQIGAVPVMIPATIWLFWSGQTGLGVMLLIITVGVGLLDNILRPLLIRQGVDLPLLLIFIGVIGGLIAFGLIGIFVGPMVLAVTYTLTDAWIKERK